MRSRELSSLASRSETLHSARTGKPEGNNECRASVRVSRAGAVSRAKTTVLLQQILNEGV